MSLCSDFIWFELRLDTGFLEPRELDVLGGARVLLLVGGSFGFIIRSMLSFGRAERQARHFWAS